MPYNYLVELSITVPVQAINGADAQEQALKQARRELNHKQWGLTVEDIYRLSGFREEEGG